MRTTLTLDDDLAEKVKAYADKKRVSFRQALNDVLRRGFTSPEGRRRPERFRVSTFDTPFRPGVDPLRLNQLSDELEVQHLAGDRSR